MQVLLEKSNAQTRPWEESGEDETEATALAPFTSQQTLVNQLLQNRFQITVPLGAGGFAKTYLAEDTQAIGNPICVVKHLRPSRQDTEFLNIARRLFKAEGQILESLGHHPQIPKLVAFFEEDKEFYIIQEFIKGKSMEKEILAGEMLSESQVIQLIKDVATALSFVHSHNYIHRDIKPSNLIRQEQDGRIVLIDFGAVKQIQPQELDNNTIVIGTRGYAPPEQMIGQPKLNSDIYALGMTAIQFLTGVEPARFQTDQNSGGLSLKSHPHKTWRDLAQTTDKLADILDKMVHNNSNLRYQSADEVIQDLEVITRIADKI